MRAGGRGSRVGRSRAGRACRVDTPGYAPRRRLTDQSIAELRRVPPVRAAAVQLTATADKATNLETADRLVRAAVRDGASLVVLPEKWSVYGTPEDQRAGAEPLDGPALSWSRAIARELEIDLVAGSIAEHVADSADGRGFNTSVHIGPDGSDRATYRKLHMFDVLVGGRDYRESDGEAPGDEIVLSALADGLQLGLTICY